MSLFETEKKPLREAIEFYKHKEGWSRLARNLKAEIDEEKIEAFKGTVSLPFEKGDNAKIAVKIIDDRGIESLRVISL
jgi:adenine-specific DNA-methyltransferase